MLCTLADGVQNAETIELLLSVVFVLEITCFRGKFGINLPNSLF